MCRLFGMHGGQHRVSATFWLLDAPGSLALQSRTQPDGYGIGTFEDDGTPDVDKGPIRAADDEAFAHEARQELSRTFVAHLRFASTGAVAMPNTHPFEQHNRLFAHNGVLWGLPELEAELGEHRALVRGDTDSERLFALVTRETERRGGDLEAGIRAAVRWVADHVPVYSLNFVLTTATDLWAMRYPATHPLWVLERVADTDVAESSSDGTIRVRAAAHRVVVVATERMDDDPAWRLLGPDELLHVDGDLRCRCTPVVGHAPKQLLTLADLDARAAASQAPQASAV